MSHTSYELPTEVESHLRLAGWRPGRKVDLTDWIDELGRDGVRFSGPAMQFLEEFGGLHLPRRSPAGVDVAPSEVDFDPAECGPIRGYVPLGEVDGGAASLGMDADGAVWMLMGLQRWRIGVGRRAVANLVLGVRD